MNINGFTTIRFELEIAAQKVINQLMLNNSAIEQQLEVGIKSAFESFDFEAAIKEATLRTIESEIRKSTNWDKMIRLVREKADKIVDDHIEKHMDNLKKSL